MKPTSVTPILYSSNVHRSIAYYTEVPGCPEKWEWDDTRSYAAKQFNQSPE